jgi:hypothetical protein
MSDNYFVLLGLDPGVEDWSVIEAAIVDRQRRWSNIRTSGKPADRRKADRWVTLLPDMRVALADPVRRREIALEAKRVLADQRAEALARLDELIGVIHDSTIDAVGVAVLVRQVGGGIGEPEVVARLKARGIAVVSGGGGGASSVARPVLDRVVEEGIRDNLRHLGFRSLYEFLGRNARSSPQSLLEAADAIYVELRRKGLTDPDSTARGELVGFAKSVFRDAEGKRRYDNSYAAEAMTGLDGLLEVAGRDKFLESAEVERVVAGARERGVDRDVAVEYIRAYAGKRKWGVQSGSDSSAVRVRLCGFCDAVARGPSDVRCHQCGQELVQPCPRCGKPTPTEDECCGSCGCSTGDAPVVQGLLREGREHLVKGDFAGATVAFERALGLWSGWQPALEGLREVEDRLQARQREAEQRRQARQALLDEIDGHLRHNRLEAAQTALERLRRDEGKAGTEALWSRVQEGVRRARRAFEDAEALRRSGKGEDAVDKYMESVAICADFQPALQALAASPPPAPASLRVTVSGSSARLSWSGVKARGTVTYRVLRKGSSAPAGPNDGEALTEVASPAFDDTSMPVGVGSYYAVFALRGGVASAGAAVSGPHVRVADVTNVVAEAGDGEVALRWQRPPGCETVEVWRATLANPAASGNGVRVPVADDTAVAQGLKNGVTYRFLIVAVFTNPTGGPVLSAPGVRVTATPVVPPPAVMDLRARKEGQSVFLEWTHPGRGDVQIRCARQAPELRPGRILSVAAVGRFGTPVPVTARGTAQTAFKDQGRVYFIPLSVVGDTAVVGTAVALTSLDDVQQLTSQRQGDAIHLTWRWPAGAAETLVVWRTDTFPTGPDDANSARRVVTRSEYDRSGNWTLRNPARVRHYFAVFVRDGEHEVYSTGAQVLESSGLESLVSYRAVNVRRGLFRRAGPSAYIELRADESVLTLPGLIAVLKPNLPPLRPGDGHTVASLDRLDFRNGVARIELDANGQVGFVKVFFTDDRHAREFRLRPGPLEQLKVG